MEMKNADFVALNRRNWEDHSRPSWSRKHTNGGLAISIDFRMAADNTVREIHARIHLYSIQKLLSTLSSYKFIV